MNPISSITGIIISCLVEANARQFVGTFDGVSKTDKNSKISFFGAKAALKHKKQRVKRIPGYYK